MTPTIYTPRKLPVLLLAVLGIVLADPSGLSESLRGYTPSMVLTVAVAFIVSFMKSRGSRTFPWVFVPFLGWVWYSYTYSVQPGNTISNALIMTAVVVTGTVIAWKLTLDEIITAIVLLGSLSLLLSGLLLIIDPETANSPIGVQGIFGHKNIFGFVLAVGFIATMCHPTFKQKWKVLLSIAFFAGMLASESTTAILIALFTIFFYWVIVKFKQTRGKSAQQIGLIVLLFSVAGAAYLTIVYGAEAILVMLGKSPTLSARTTIWEAVDHYISLEPVRGYGFGAIWDQESPVGALIRHLSTQSATHAHNGYRDILLGTGTIGLVLFSLVLLVATVQGIRLVSRFPLPAGAWNLMILTFMFMVNIFELRFLNPLGALLLVLVLTVRAPKPVKKVRGVNRVRREKVATVLEVAA